jgi:kinesin family protein 11
MNELHIKVEMESEACLAIDPLLHVSSHGVQVSCRFRCQNEAELIAGGTTCVSFPDNHSFLLNAINGTTRHTAFDNVFSEEITQEEVYKRVGAPFVKDLLSGYNCTILAYGQTGRYKNVAL